MKKTIAVLALSALLAGCATGPEKGYYDANGNYVPSADAQNADSWATAGVVAGTAAAIAGVTLGIVALTK